MKKLVTVFFGLSSLLSANAALADGTSPDRGQNQDDSGWQTIPNAPPPPASEGEPEALPPALPQQLPPQQEQPVGTATTTNAVVEKDGAQEAPPLEVESKAMRPMQIDLRMGLNTNPVLSYIGFGLAADVGVTKTGPGTIALGAGWEHSACATSCWEFESATPYMDFSERQNWAQARASYHLGLKSVPRLDAYPLLSLGPVFASSTVDLDGGATRYRGRNTTLGLGMGGGFTYSVYGPLFVGAEARIRYAAGGYEYRLINGREKGFDRASVEGFSLNGLDAFFAFGARLP